MDKEIDKEARDYFNYAYLMSQQTFEMSPMSRERAIKFLLKAIEIEPEYYQAYADLGVKLLLWGKYNEALPFYKKTLQIDPTSKNALSLKSPLCDMGWALERLGKFEEAIACYNKVVEIDPNSDIQYAIAAGRRLSDYNGKIVIGGREIKRDR